MNCTAINIIPSTLGTIRDHRSSRSNLVSKYIVTTNIAKYNTRRLIPIKEIRPSYIPRPEMHNPTTGLSTVLRKMTILGIVRSRYVSSWSWFETRYIKRPMRLNDPGVMCPLCASTDFRGFLKSSSLTRMDFLCGGSAICIDGWRNLYSRSRPFFHHFFYIRPNEVFGWFPCVMCRRPSRPFNKIVFFAVDHFS